MGARLTAPPKLVWDNILTLPYYQPGKPIEEVERELGISDIIKLASNENPHGPSPKVIEVIRTAATEVHRYPDAMGFALKEKLAAFYDIPREQIGLGNGTDQILFLLATAFLHPDEEAIVPDPTFMRYATAIQMMNARCRSIPLKDWRMDLDAMAAAITAKTKMIFLCSPNNPTGPIARRRELEIFLEQVPRHVIVVFDEAYREFVEDEDYPDSLDHLRDGRRLMILRTFSKAYGLAGLRIGYGITTPELANVLMRVRPPFNTTTMAQRAAIAALDDQDWLRHCVTENGTCKRLLYAGLDGLDVDYVPTESNFILMDVHRDNRVVFDRLLHRGVIIRPLAIGESTSHMRVSIGARSECERFLETFAEVLEKTPRLAEGGRS